MLGNDRRKHTRLALRLPLSLKRSGESRTVSSVTENLSVGGFYFVTEEPFAPGDRLDCTLLMLDAAYQQRLVRLCCDSQVQWVQAVGGGAGFGVGCRILDYVVRLEGSG